MSHPGVTPQDVTGDPRERWLSQRAVSWGKGYPGGWYPVRGVGVQKVGTLPIPWFMWYIYSPPEHNDRICENITFSQLCWWAVIRNISHDNTKYGSSRSSLSGRAHTFFFLETSRNFLTLNENNFPLQMKLRKAAFQIWDIFSTS